MAKRDRVPRHKSHTKHRNKNAKLSPFQREQKRAKLANQAPTLKSQGTERDIPHSQRHVYEYLLAKKEREEAKKRKKLEEEQTAAAAAEAEEDDVEEHNDSHSDSGSSGSSSHLGAEEGEEDEITTSNTNKGTIKKTKLEKTVSSEKNAKKVKTMIAGEKKSKADTETEAAVVVVTDSKQSAQKTTKKKSITKMGGIAMATVASLNTEFSSTVGPAIRAFREIKADEENDAEDDTTRPRTVEEIIAKKKARKHARKSELRRQRVAAELQGVEEKLKDLVNKANGKKKKKRGGEDGETEKDGNFNIAFERKLRELQREEAARKATEKKTDASAAAGENTAAEGRRKKRRRGDGDEEVHGGVAAASSSSETPCKARVRRESGDEGGSTAGQKSARKSISFDGVPDTNDGGSDSGSGDLPHRAMRYPGDVRSSAEKQGKRKPKDFYELVDVVRYGERVEAPPVFDVVPNRNAAVSRLANKLERESGVKPRGGNSSRADDRFRLLSSVGGLGEQKRLARLGLAPAVTGTVRASASSQSSLSKEKEMELLRARVMSTYQKNKRKDVEAKKGVDMKHAFPQFS